jgi:hypothetical protein
MIPLLSSLHYILVSDTTIIIIHIILTYNDNKVIIRVTKIVNYGFGNTWVIRTKYKYFMNTFKNI